MVESTKVIPVHLPKTWRFRKNMRGKIPAFSSPLTTPVFIGVSGEKVKSEVPV